MNNLPDYSQPHRLDDPGECWCNPTTEEHSGGRLIIHHDPEEAVEEAQKILEESKPFENEPLQ